MPSSHQRPIPEKKLSDGLDRQNIVLIQKRFMAINDARLARMRSAFNSQQKLCLDTLTLLFHSNHPMMPGFISRIAPCGVMNYQRDNAQLKLGQKIAKSFTFNPTGETQEDIHGIYVMGSVGTIAQSESSDLDIWICHDESLSKDACKLLNQKCEKISQWAASKKIEMHFFLMNAEKFQKQSLSNLTEESSGSAQKYLLLDEFYRSAIYIGGKTPLWWMIPTNAEAHYYQYSQTILNNRFAKTNHVLDFGSINTIPDGEFVGAGIWQLYKAIESPYKSVLKLLLLEAYASDHPNITPLSLHFKKMVYAGSYSIDELDSYLLVYQTIEKYLTRKKQFNRLELVRRCLYFKINLALSSTNKVSGIRSKTNSWQHTLLTTMVHAWRWNEADLKFLDNRKNWKAADVSTERALLVSELNHSYHFLIDFGNHTQSTRDISSNEITILGRKLQAAFERRPGKIEWINPGISKNIAESKIFINCENDAKSHRFIWSITSFEHPDFFKIGSRSTTQYNTSHLLKTSSSLIECLLWCFYNGVITENTHIDLSKSSHVTSHEVKNIIEVFTHWIPFSNTHADHHVFEKMAFPQRVLILVNTGSDPLAGTKQDGIHRISNQTDPLNYSGFRQNLVKSVDIITQNSWNEIHTRRFDGDLSLTDALEEYLQLCIPGSHHTPPELHIECIGDTMCAPIANRVREWFDSIIDCFFNQPALSNPRYVFTLGKSFYCLQYKNSKMHVTPCKTLKHLTEHLACTQKTYSDIEIDSFALRDHPLKTCVKLQQEQCIQVFYFKQGATIDYYVLDEKNSLYISKIDGNAAATPLQALHRFLRIATGRLLHSDIQLRTSRSPAIHFYELTKGQSVFKCLEKRISSAPILGSIFDVKAIAYEEDKKVFFDYHCDSQEFSAVSFGEQLEIVVAQFILSRREKNKDYPLHLSDLDISLCKQKLSDDGKLQTIHYLKVKAILERKLNHAIGILSRE